MATLFARRFSLVSRLSSVSLRSAALLPKCSSTLGVVNQRNASQEFYSKNKRLGRPTSPHLLIYKFEGPSLLSISHRITGIIQSGVVSLAAIGILLAPESLEHYVNYLHSLELPRAFWISTKMLIAWPFMYHLCNGIRHLGWDVSAKGLNKVEIVRTGYITLLASFLLTAGLIWFY